MTNGTTTKLTAAFAIAIASLGVSATPAFAGDRHHDRYERGDYYGDRHYEDRYDRRYSDRDVRYDRDYRDDRRYNARCRDKGTGGTIIGAIAGGILGHEIAGRRGDRTTGVIIGGAVGAVAGRAIDKGSKRC